MAIQTAGQKTAKTTKIRIENKSTSDLPKDTDTHIEKVLDFIPTEHLRGLEKMRLVDFINDPRLKNLDIPIKGDIPGLYHPGRETSAMARNVDGRRYCRRPKRFSKSGWRSLPLRGNLAGLLFSLVGQHYHLTLRHSVKKQNLEPQIRQCAEKN